MLDQWEKIHSKLALQVDLQVAHAETIPAVFSGAKLALRPDLQVTLAETIPIVFSDRQAAPAETIPVMCTKLALQVD